MFRSINTFRSSNEATSWGRAFQNFDSTFRTSDIERVQRQNARRSASPLPAPTSRTYSRPSDSHAPIDAPSTKRVYAVVDQGRVRYARTTGLYMLKDGFSAGKIDFFTFNLESALELPPKRWENNEGKNPLSHTRMVFEFTSEDMISRMEKAAEEQENREYMRIYKTDFIPAADNMKVYNVSKKGNSDLTHTYKYDHLKKHFTEETSYKKLKVITFKDIKNKIKKRKEEVANRKKQAQDSHLEQRSSQYKMDYSALREVSRYDRRDLQYAHQDNRDPSMLSPRKPIPSRARPPIQEQRREPTSRQVPLGQRQGQTPIRYIGEPAQTRPSNDRLPVPHSQFPRVPDPDTLTRTDWGTLRDAGVDFRTDSLFDNRKPHNNQRPHR